METNTSLEFKEDSIKYLIKLKQDEDTDTKDELFIRHYKLKYQGWDLSHKLIKWNLKFFSEGLYLYKDVSIAGHIPNYYNFEAHLDYDRNLVVPVVVENPSGNDNFTLHFEAVNKFSLKAKNSEETLYTFYFNGHACSVIDVKSWYEVLVLYREVYDLSFGNLKFKRSVPFPYNIAIVLSLTFLSYCQRYFIYRLHLSINTDFKKYSLSTDKRYITHFEYGAHIAFCLSKQHLKAFRENSIDNLLFWKDTRLFSMGTDLMKGYSMAKESNFSKSELKSLPQPTWLKTKKRYVQSDNSSDIYSDQKPLL